MKKKDWQELKTKNIENLKKFISDKQKELVGIRLELKMDKIKNVHQLAQLRKDIARAKTILKIKQIMQEVEKESVK